MRHETRYLLKEALFWLGGAASVVLVIYLLHFTYQPPLCNGKPIFFLKGTDADCTAVDGHQR